MSVGFLLEFVNNTSLTIGFNAKVIGKATDDWESATKARPDVDLKGCTLGPFSRRSFHEERANNRRTAPFTVAAAFADGNAMSFVLDGCDAIYLANDGEVSIQRGSRDYSVFQMISHASEVGDDNDYNKMTLFITPRVSPSGWMGRLLKRKPDITLPEITIPGTHESGTAGGNGEMGTRCQNLTI